VFICENAGLNFTTLVCCCDAFVTDHCTCAEFTAW
jgi:hypothetical protein